MPAESLLSPHGHIGYGEGEAHDRYDYDDGCADNYGMEWHGMSGTGSPKCVVGNAACDGYG